MDKHRLCETLIASFALSRLMLSISFKELITIILSQPACAFKRSGNRGRGYKSDRKNFHSVMMDCFSGLKN